MFSERLKQLRKENNLSQDKIAELLNVSRQSYGRYEAGISEPGIDTLIRISDIFDVSLDFLLGRTDSMHNVSMMCDGNQDFIMQLIDLINKYNCQKR